MNTTEISRANAVLTNLNLWGLVGFVAWGFATFFLRMPDSYQAFSFIFLMPWVWNDGIKGVFRAAPVLVVYTLVQLILPSPNLTLESISVALFPGLIALGFVAFLRERDRDTRAELEQSLRQMQSLEQGSLEISNAADPLELTESAMSALLKLGMAPHLAFVRFRDGRPVVVSARGAFERYRGRQLPAQKLSAHASLSDSFQVGSYLEGIPESAGWSSAAVPVSARQKRPLGVVLLARDGQQPFEPEEKAMANSLARVMGAQLGQMEAVKELEAAYDGTLRALGLALEYRDHETQGHTKRVVAWSDQLAQDLGLSASERKYLRWGAYLHDIGKLSISDSILLKPGKLDDREWEIMKTHVTLGYEILSKVPFLPEETLEVVRFHHESWDGSGYPNGKKGEEIPLLARIFAIVDVFDALYSTRPYKLAWKPAEIIAELKRLKGRKFDPNLVDVFIKRLTTSSNATQGGAHATLPGVVEVGKGR
ncbi:MAG: HD domain-containing protein [Meiothermus sp.]|nr:HD domain-containing protein [Meiothermus sp.]